MELIGAQLGKYHVVERISAGGMAEVYKAYQPDLDRYVAIKIIAPDLSHDPAFLAQFKREAQVLARLQHPNILPIYDSGDYEGQPYLVMQYHRGGTLADCLGHSQPTWQVVDIVSQVGDALAYAHAHGVVHRDVKPSNILLAESGRPLLADFGLAAALNAPAETAGTRGYIAPEQRDGKPVDGRADIFSLGVILYELLTGANFGRQNILTRSMAINHLPPSIITVITCSANWKVANRYDLAEDFVAALQAAYLSATGSGPVAQTATQTVLEIVAIVLFALAGLGLIVYGFTLPDPGNRAVAIGLGLVSLLISGLFVARERSQPLTTKFLRIIMLVFLGGVMTVYPLSLLAGYPLMNNNTLSDIWPVMLPGSIVLGLCLVRYERARRLARDARARSITPPVKRRPSLQEIRQTRNALINTVIIIVGIGVIVWLVSELIPRDSDYAWVRSMLSAGVVFDGLLLVLSLAVWYIFSLVTAATTTPEAAPRSIATRVRVRQDRLDKAQQYVARLRRQIEQARDGALRDRLRRATTQLDDYVDYLERLTLRLDQLERDPLIQRDRSTVPRAVERLEWRLTLEDDDEDERVKESARQTLAARQRQLEYLTKLDAIVQQTELRCEQAVAELGTLYSQVLLIDAKDIDGARARQVQTDIDLQIVALHAVADTLDEIEHSRLAVST